MRIRTGDNVLVIAGRDKGQTGRVERNFLPREGRVVVEGVNVVTKHMRATARAVRQAGRIQFEAPIHVVQRRFDLQQVQSAYQAPDRLFWKPGARVRSLQQVPGSDRRCSMTKHNSRILKLNRRKSASERRRRPFPASARRSAAPTRLSPRQRKHCASCCHD